MKILFLSTYPIDKGPSQRFRIGLYLPGLREAGHELSYVPFYNDNAWFFIFSQGNIFKKSKALAKGAFARFKLLFTLHRCDVIFVQREVSPIGPPFLLFYATKILGKKVIFDFDDAIWIPNYTQENALFHRLKAYWKIALAIRWATVTIAGNEYLAEYARKYSSQVMVIPTVVDTAQQHTSTRDRRVEAHIPIVGWTGSISTIKHLLSLNKVLSIVQKECPFRMHVIANKNPKLVDLDYHFIPWSAENEIRELDRFDIGLMPLPDNEWTRGKCGFKAIQYMSLGIATLSSPVGMNTQLITDGSNGFLCDIDELWKARLNQLINDTDLRQRIGEEGQITIEKHYSLASQFEAFKTLFE